jgi:hypothetical protein
MKKTLLGRLSYSNVVATLALFLVLAGGTAYAASHLGKNAVKSKNIAPGAVKSKNLAKGAVKEKNIAKGAVTSAKLKAGSLTRSQFAPGALAGTQVTELQASSVPGLGEAESPDAGTPVPLTGNATVTPVAGKSYEILTEMKGNPVDADGAGGNYCYGEVSIFANGQYLTYAEVFADQSSQFAPYRLQPLGTHATAFGLLDAGQPVTLTALSFTNGDCKPITASFKATVIELG